MIKTYHYYYFQPEFRAPFQGYTQPQLWREIQRRAALLSLAPFARSKPRASYIFLRVSRLAVGRFVTLKRHTLVSGRATVKRTIVVRVRRGRNFSFGWMFLVSTPFPSTPLSPFSTASLALQRRTRRVHWECNVTFDNDRTLLRFACPLCHTSMIRASYDTGGTIKCIG